MTLPVPISNTHLAEALATHTPVVLTTPHEALAFSLVADTLARLVYGQSRDTLPTDQQVHLVDALDAYAIPQGWRYLSELINPRWVSRSAAYIRPLQPNLPRLEARLKSYFATTQRIPYAYEVLQTGLTVAFPAGVREDPNGIVPPVLWNHLLAPYGFHWNGNPESLLTPLLPELAASDLEQMGNFLETLPQYAYFATTQRKQAGNGTPILLVSDLLEALVTMLGWNPMLRALPPQALLEQADIRRTLTKGGWSVHPLHADPYQVTPTPPHKVVALARLLSFPTSPRPVEIAPGFFPHVTKLVTHNETLIYLEIAGTRTALKASRAQILGTRRHVLFEREILISREDGFQTLRTPMPCGWEHWALLHRQVSLQTATPDPFYLLDEGTSLIPPLFAAMLARALPLPIQSAWTEYLWVEGRLAGLIQPVPDTHGIGAWHVTLPAARWQSLLQEGLASGSLTF